MQDLYLASAREFLFEYYVIHLFCTGNHKFEIKNLKEKGSDQFFIYSKPKVGHIKIVSDLSKYPKENTVIMPDKQNFGITDLFVTSYNILQVTMSEDHPINQAKLVNIINEMLFYKYNKNTKLWLYFAVPDEIYDNFKHQKYTTKDKDSKEDCPVKIENSTLRNVEQWALKVQINPILKEE